MSSDLDYFASLFDRATLLKKQEQYDQALAGYNECLGFFRRSGDRVNEAKALSQIARVHEARGEWEEAIRIQQESLDLNRAAGNESDRAGGLLQLAILLLKRGYEGDSEQAMKHLKDAEVVAQQSNNRKLQASVIHEQALILGMKGNLRQAHMRLVDSLEVSESLGDREGVAISVSEIGRLLVELARRAKAKGDASLAQEILAEAEKSIRRGCEIFRSLQKPGEMALSLLHLGGIHEFRGELEAALDAYLKAKALCERYNAAATGHVDRCISRLRAKL